MRKNVALFLPLTLAFIVVACATYDGSRVARWESRFHDSSLGPVTPDQLLAEAHVKLDIIPSGTVGRRYYRPMNPRYITIHSTQNYTGNAYQHALALKRGALRATKRKGGNRIGFLTWHFTVQDDIAIQHLPVVSKGSTLISMESATTTASALRCASTMATTWLSPLTVPRGSPRISCAPTIFRSITSCRIIIGLVSASVRCTRTARISCWSMAALVRRGGGFRDVYSFITTACNQVRQRRWVSL